MVGLALAISIICLPFIEIYLALQVTHQIGVAPTLALLALLSLSGPLLVKYEGVGVWRRARARMQLGEVPGRELTDGVFLLLTGVLLTVPGFLTATAGILLLLPPVRALVRWLAGLWVGGQSHLARLGLRAYSNAPRRRKATGDRLPPGAGRPIDAAARDGQPSRRSLAAGGEQ